MNTAAATDFSAAAGARAEPVPQGDTAMNTPARHWQGDPIQCDDCEYVYLRPLGEGLDCEPGHACVQDVYARRIDRFFRWRPLRLPQAQLNKLATDPHREVCIRVAQRLEKPALLRMADDPDPGVRQVVRERLNRNVPPMGGTHG